MAYKTPIFNLGCNIWRNGNPVSNPPDVVASCALALGDRITVAAGNLAGGSGGFGGMWLLLPPGTDIRDDKAPAGVDVVEVTPGSGRFYKVRWVDDGGAGWSNEYRFAELIGFAPWPVPFPRVGTGNPPSRITFEAGVIGTWPSPLIQFFTPPPNGNRIVLVVEVSAAHGFGTVSGSISGPLAQIYSYESFPGVWSGPLFLRTAMYLQVPGGPVETLSYTPLSNGAQYMASYSLNRSVFDVGNFAIGVANPLLLNVVPPTATLDCGVAWGISLGWTGVAAAFGSFGSIVPPFPFFNDSAGGQTTINPVAAANLLLGGITESFPFSGGPGVAMAHATLFK